MMEILKKKSADSIPKELKKQIYFVIPAYNEGKAIENVLKDLVEKGYQNLVVINDGSKDNTSKVVQELKLKQITLLEHVINRGQGAALQTGMTYCLKQKDCKYIVHFDSDGQMRISDLPKFLAPLEKGMCDIALGSRFLLKESRKLVPTKKIILLKTALVVTWVLSRIWLTDTHNGYRVMNKRAAAKIDITMDGFEHASEILDEISKKRIPYREVPVYIDYTEYAKQKGQKISNSIKIFLKMFFK